MKQAYSMWHCGDPAKQMIQEKALIPETKPIEALTNEEFDACYCIVKKAFKILSDFVYKTNLDSKYDSRQIKSKWQSHDVYQCILRGVWVDVKLL